MTAIPSPELDGTEAASASRPAGRRTGRRGELDALGLLVGMLGTLLVVVIVMGSASPVGP